jgi:hypothetical protein
MKDTKVKFTIPKGTHKLVKNLDKLEPQTIGCGREIEKLKAEIWNKHYSTQEAFSINIDKLVSLVIISQLKEIKTILKKYEHLKLQPMVTELNNLLKEYENIPN